MSHGPSFAAIENAEAESWAEIQHLSPFKSLRILVMAWPRFNPPRG